MASRHCVPTGGRRSFFMALSAMLLVAGCGGGSGDSGVREVSPVVIQGTWELTATSKGVTSHPVSVPGTAVPTQVLLSRLTANDIAKLLALLFQDYTTSVEGSTLTVTGSDTSYQLTVNSFTVSDYMGCGACGVGSTVTYTATVGFSESGTFKGQAIPPGKGTLVVDFRYLRTA